MRAHRAIGQVRAAHGVEMQRAHLWKVSMLIHADLVLLLDPPAVHLTWQVTYGSRESIGSGGMAAGTPCTAWLQESRRPAVLPRVPAKPGTRSSSNAFDFLSRIFTVAAASLLPL